MGPKRRQGFPQHFQDSGVSSEDEKGTDVTSHPNSPPAKSAKCPHVAKAVHVPGLKKQLKTSWAKIGHCNPCVREKNKAKIGTTPSAKDTKDNKDSKDNKECKDSPDKELKKKPSFWLCLRCGLQFCDSNASNHLSVHFSETSYSDLHCIMINVTAKHEDDEEENKENKELFCWKCDKEIQVDTFKKLREAVDFVRKVEESKGRAGVVNKSKTGFNMGPTRQGSVTAAPGSSNGQLPKARGLSNLGNTCFFNAVLQSLTQSHPMTHALDMHGQKGAPLAVPAVTLTDGEQLEAMTLQLAEAGPITLSLAAAIKEMTSLGRTGIYNPGHLFGQVCRRSPHFRGGQQQDSHELLRHLLEGLRAEEVKRQRSAILKAFGLSEKTDPKSVPVFTRKKLQALARHSNHTLVDKIFGGQLVSTIVCETCHNSSQIYEPFLDLSLPLVEEKPPRPQHKKSISEDTGSGEVSCFGTSSGKSKSQMKKEKQQNKRNKRKGRKGGSSGGLSSAGNSKDVGDEDIDGTGNDNNEDNSEKKSCNDDEEEEAVEGEAAISKSSENKSDDKDLETATQGSRSVSEEFASVPSSLPKDEEDAEQDQPPPEAMEEEATEEKVEEEPMEEEKAEEEPAEEKAEDEEDEVVEKTELKLPESNSVSNKTSAFETAAKSKKRAAAGPADGNEEDDEEDGSSEEEEEEDWEWDYGEEWEEGEEDKKKEGSEERRSSTYLEVEGKSKASSEEKQGTPLRSLNPLPLERLERGSSERERSAPASDAANNPESDSGASSSDGDVEDNLDDSNVKRAVFNPDPEHLDAHMEQLCRKVRKFSVATVVMKQEGEEQEQEQSEVIEEEDGDDEGEGDKDDTKLKTRLQNEWVARTITSIAPRYHAKAGECSVYSCLTQFTAPELLTGQNKWACERCTQIKREKSKSESESEEGDGKDKKKKKKSETVYSNASKQLLIFSPPSVLTVQLKRFQQTLFNIRKVNKHVNFPLNLNLAPFCSTTAVSQPTVAAGAKELMYNLYAIVEHSGSLRGGHYTAYVKVRPAGPESFNRFYSGPTTKTDEVYALLGEIERKIREEEEEKKKDQEVKSEEVLPPSKWYFASDGHVMEVSEDKVLKCQAYLLFYERAS